MTNDADSTVELSQPIPPSSQYVRSYPACNCGQRWLCAECRETWVRRRQRTTMKWLRHSASASTCNWFSTLTIPTEGSWLSETGELWKRWKRIGRLRSLHRQRAVPGELAAIRRGIASLHLVNRDLSWQPHIHAVFVADADFQERAIVDCWHAQGRGYAEIEHARSFGAVVRYSIAGQLPQPLDDCLAISRMLRGVRIVRRIGR